MQYRFHYITYILTFKMYNLIIKYRHHLNVTKSSFVMMRFVLQCEKIYNENEKKNYKLFIIQFYSQNTFDEFVILITFVLFIISYILISK